MTSPFGKILCAVDFDDLCDVALETATRLLPSDGVLYVLHAARFPYALTDEEAALPLSSAKERLDEMVRKLLSADRFEILVERNDDAARSILKRARRLAIDCIVIPTHARKGLDHLLLGSVAEKVVRQAPCRVVTVRPPLAG